MEEGEGPRVKTIIRHLSKLFPQPRLELDFTNPLECLVATILSAQCTDARVNQVTPRLFERYRTALDYSKACPASLERLIRPTGFYRAKTRSLIACSQALVERHGGTVPDTLEALAGLPGVGRKTANVVLGACFGRQTMAVDTHVKRVARRLGLTRHEHPDRIEQDLIRLIPSRNRTATNMRLVLFGRRVCTARKPLCPSCPIERVCPFEPKTPSRTPATLKKAK